MHTTKTAVSSYNVALYKSGLQTQWIFIRVQVRVRVYKKIASSSSSSLSSIFQVYVRGRVRQKKTEFIELAFAALGKTETKTIKSKAKTRINGFESSFTAKYYLLFMFQNYSINELEIDLRLFRVLIQKLLFF